MTLPRGAVVCTAHAPCDAVHVVVGGVFATHSVPPVPGGAAGAGGGLSGSYVVAASPSASSLAAAGAAVVFGSSASLGAAASSASAVRLRVGGGGSVGGASAGGSAGSSAGFARSTLVGTAGAGALLGGAEVATHASEWPHTVVVTSEVALLLSLPRDAFERQLAQHPALVRGLRALAAAAGADATSAAMDDTLSAVKEGARVPGGRDTGGYGGGGGAGALGDVLTGFLSGRRVDPAEALASARFAADVAYAAAVLAHATHGVPPARAEDVVALARAARRGGRRRRTRPTAAVDALPPSALAALRAPPPSRDARWSLARMPFAERAAALSQPGPLSLATAPRIHASATTAAAASTPAPAPPPSGTALQRLWRALKKLPERLRAPPPASPGPAAAGAAASPGGPEDGDGAHRPALRSAAAAAAADDSDDEYAGDPCAPLSLVLRDGTALDVTRLDLRALRRPTPGLNRAPFRRRTTAGVSPRVLAPTRDAAVTASGGGGHVGGVAHAEGALLAALGAQNEALYAAHVHASFAARTAALAAGGGRVLTQSSIAELALAARAVAACKRVTTADPARSPPSARGGDGGGAEEPGSARELPRGAAAAASAFGAAADAVLAASVVPAPAAASSIALPALA